MPCDMRDAIPLWHVFELPHPTLIIATLVLQCLVVSIRRLETVLCYKTDDCQGQDSGPEDFQSPAADLLEPGIIINPQSRPADLQRSGSGIRQKGKEKKDAHSKRGQDARWNVHLLAWQALSLRPGKQKER